MPSLLPGYVPRWGAEQTVLGEQDSYGARVLDFAEDLRNLLDYDSICARITEEFSRFGYSHLTVWNMPSSGEAMGEALLYNDRPEDYTDHYIRDNLVERDPVVRELRTTLSPYTWDDVRKKTSSKSARRIIDEAREFGVRNGVTIPIFRPSGSLAVVSPCGREPDVSPRATIVIEMISILSFQALRRARATMFREKRDTPPLTNREREVLTWVAVGKSDDEIATILSIGRQTVLTHLGNAKRKLNASRRTYAVVQALRYGEIVL